MAIENPNQQKLQALNDAREILDELIQELVGTKNPNGTLFRHLLETNVIRLAPMSFDNPENFEAKGVVFVNHHTLPDEKTKIVIEIHPSPLKQTVAPQDYEVPFRRAIKEAIDRFTRLKKAGARF